MQDRIGPALKQARLDRGASLRAVAAAVGISASQLSQIENNKSQPSVSTLYALVHHLEISLDDLLGIPHRRTIQPPADSPDNAGGQVVQRGTDNPVIEMANGVRWEKLAVGPGSDVDALLVTYEPGAASSVDRMPMRHSGTEYAYLFSGELTLLLGFDKYTISAGDSLWFDSTRPHIYVNQTDQPARGVWFVSGRHESGPTREWVAAQLGEPTPGRSPRVNSAVDALDLLGAATARSSPGNREA
ncbi:helix-turn-helix domain-containing protein [Nocardia puris]|uniref:XRE family transcriptional regulator n=1 Tax=Nocardia puris TaxID=208602 RepID=A0A366CXA0_9NOCA|nr:cupin domain-containing protein [Nocardia puris]MBF6215424.1 helix-turn-helix domain-containing protein [Nocardia puris]MBF6369956.1 helix-turn-helix domain-containing protein [Nocardia puris]RBO82443.1 XRE family transcriptional regulator [Nocardia puris]